MQKITLKIDNEIKHNSLVFTTKQLLNNKDYEKININQSWSDKSSLHIYKY